MYNLTNKLPRRRANRLRDVRDELPRNSLFGVVQSLSEDGCSPPVREVLTAETKGESDNDNAETRTDIESARKNEIVLGCDRLLAFVVRTLVDMRV